MNSLNQLVLGSSVQLEGSKEVGMRGSLLKRIDARERMSPDDFNLEPEAQKLYPAVGPISTSVDIVVEIVELVEVPDPFPPRQLSQRVL